MSLEAPQPDRKAALVTGAGRRVGAAIARALGDAGWDVALHFHGSRAGAEEGAKAVEAKGGRAALVRGDLTIPDDCAGVVDQTLAALGHLDLLVCSAAGFEPAPFDELDAAKFDAAMALNVRAPLLLAHRARHALRARGGSVVVITCTSATFPYAGFLPYVVSKGAAHQLVRTLALELAPEVRVNAVAPGTVLLPEHYDEHQRRSLAAKTLLGRLGTPDDVARAVLYLASASFVTGHEILVDGGVALAGRPSGE
jgi:pteridine reductase